MTRPHAEAPVINCDIDVYIYLIYLEDALSQKSMLEQLKMAQKVC